CVRILRQNAGKVVWIHGFAMKRNDRSAERDTIFAVPRRSVEQFVFDDRVAAVFDDMINRSVPLYQEVQEATAALAGRFLKPGTAVYDLGCSTGETLIRLCEGISDPTVRFVGIDSSAPMLERCREKLADAGHLPRVELRVADILADALENASVIVMNYTLQF